jgi:acetyl-CoA carboxylase biotin carboxyl carrier protein
MSKDFTINKKAVQDLAAILKETDLTEIEYETEHAHIRVKRHIKTTQLVHTQPQDMQPTPVQTVAEPEKVIDPIHHPGAVKSPMVGTAYMAPDPDSAPFIKVGDTVTKGQTLMIIEAMKVMNPIKAPKDGRIINILVSDTSPIEFNDVLLVIE